LVVLIEPVVVKREHIVFLVLIAAQLPIDRPTRLRVLTMLHIHTASGSRMILLLLQLECLLYVESRHLNPVLDLDSIINCLLRLLLHHSLFTLNSRRCILDLHVAARA